MQGQANHFVRYSLSELPEKYSTDRYVNEARRLYRVVDKHLRHSKTEFLVGGKLTIADIAISSWANLLGKFREKEAASGMRLMTAQSSAASIPTSFPMYRRGKVASLSAQPSERDLMYLLRQTWKKS